MKKNNLTLIINSILFIIFGFVIMIYPDFAVEFSSYTFGGLLIGIGLYRTISYYIHDKNLGVVNTNELAFGVTAFILGLVFLFLADAIVLVLRFIVGFILILSGTGKIMKTFYTTLRDSRFYSLIIIGVIMILLGIYTITVKNIAISVIGIFMLIYGITEFVSLFLNNKKEEKNEVKEAEYIEKKPNKKK